MALTIKKILVPVDFSDDSRPAVDYAIALGDKLGAEVTLLHVVDYPPPYSQVEALTMVAPVEGEVTFDAFLRKRAHQDMSEFSAGYPRDAFKTDFQSGPAAEGIVQSAKDGDYDLVVMGTHGRTGLSRLMIGSVAERTIRTAPCPVLTIPPAREN
ncbi:MAG: universal stress protein [Myxococcota bacterium]